MYYTLKRTTETIGSIRLEVECLADLDQTIDELFVELQKKGDPSLLEELCPYFGTVWPSARALSETLTEPPYGANGLAHKRVLEIGCGLAIPSQVAALLGAEVTATDFHPEVPKFLEQNLALNHLTDRVRYVRMNWQKETDLATELGLFDFVIGSDILYERFHPEPVARAMTRFLKPHGTLILADPARPYIQDFTDFLTKKMGFRCETNVRTVSHGETLTKDVFVLTFVR